MHLTAREKSSILAFGIPLLVYLLTLAPDLTWAHYGADGGDLASAAYRLGVPHPPGYPTYTLLAWLFTRLPLGNVAWRVNLLSAISTATAAAIIHWIVARMLHYHTRPVHTIGAGAPRFDPGPSAIGLIAGLGAAWSYAFAPLVWSQALITEVYAVAGLWTALILGLAVFHRSKWDGLPGSTKLPLALGFVWGVGLGIHMTLVFLVPVVMWGAWRRSGSVFRSWVYFVVGLLAGLLVWLYLPLRAGRSGITWGQPATWEGFWWMVSGALYRNYLFALPASAIGQRLRAWAHTWGGGIGPSGMGLATLGAFWLAGRWRGWLVATVLSFFLFNVYALGYDTADSVVYLTPAFVVGCIWLGVGLAGVMRQVRDWSLESRWMIPLMLTLAFVTPAWTLVRNAGALDLSDDHKVRRFCQSVARDAPARAILLTASDRQTFALWYCQNVQGIRSDLAIVDEGLRGFEWYQAGLSRNHPDLWREPLDVGVPAVLTDKRPQCRVRREETQTGWLDCPIAEND